MEREERLRELVKECRSFNELFRRLGMTSSGSSLRRLKEELELYGIDYKFIPEKIGGKRAKIPLDKILKEGILYSSKDLKRRLITSGIKEDKCEICGVGNVWNGKPLTLHLDHINGIHTDNRLENLRVLCPNCHSQTETFAGRNNPRVKEDKFCCDCGKKISRKNSTRCYSCAAKFRESLRGFSSKPTREELIESLKQNTISEVARLHNVTYSAVRKWCISYNIPHTKVDLGKYLETVSED